MQLCSKIKFYVYLASYSRVELKPKSQDQKFVNDWSSILSHKIISSNPSEQSELNTKSQDQKVRTQAQLFEY